jgi:hypothetical protein
MDQRHDAVDGLISAFLPTSFAPGAFVSLTESESGTIGPRRHGCGNRQVIRR